MGHSDTLQEWMEGGGESKVLLFPYEPPFFLSNEEWEVVLVSPTPLESAPCTAQRSCHVSVAKLGCYGGGCVNYTIRRDLPTR